VILAPFLGAFCAFFANYQFKDSSGCGIRGGFGTLLGCFLRRVCRLPVSQTAEAVCGIPGAFCTLLANYLLNSSCINVHI
jgi:hypothetical protein